MIRTVIIDDEPRNIKLIDSIIHGHCPGVELVGSTGDLAEVAPLVEELKPDLLLLDISFPAGTIFPVLEKISFSSYHVIFITAHNTYASEAFQQDAVDYLLKPITEEAFIRAIKRVETKMRINSSAGSMTKLAEELRARFIQAKKIPLPSPEGILFIDQENIVRCEASGRYTVLYLTANKKLTVTRTLKEMESLLNLSQFFRVHHSHIINLNMLKMYHRSGIAELSDGTQVEVSHSRRSEFLHVLLSKNGA